MTSPYFPGLGTGGGTSTDRINGVVAALAIKAPCVTVSTADIDLLTGGLLTINSVVTAAGDRVLVKDQTDPVENGIYNVATGAWSRAADFDGNRDVVQGTLCPVYNSVSATHTHYVVTTSNNITIGTTALTFTVVADPADSAANVGLLINPRSQAEINAGVADYAPGNNMGDIVQPWYPDGNPLRYGVNTTPGTTDMTVALQAATNVNSHSGQKTVHIPAGLYSYSVLYIYYDSVDNPNFNNAYERTGKMTLKGDRCLDISGTRNYSYGSYTYGTVLECIAGGRGIVAATDNTGSGANHTRSAGPPITNQPRAFEIIDMTLVANTDGYMVEMGYMPNFRFFNCSFKQFHINGDGIYFQDAWWGMFENVAVLGPGADVSTGRAVIGGNNTSAGMFTWNAGVMDDWQDLFVWESSANWNGMAFRDLGFQKMNRYGFHLPAASAGIRHLEFDNCHWENSQYTATSYIRIDGTGLKHLCINSTYFLCGADTPVTSFTTGIYLESIESFEISSSWAFRLRSTFMHIEDTANTECPGKITNSSFVNTDALTGLIAGDVKVVTLGAGVNLPEFDKISCSQWNPPYYDQTDIVWLFDYANDSGKMDRMFDSFSRTSQMRSIASGVELLTDVDAIQYLGGSNQSFVDITTIAATTIRLPDPDNCIDGKIIMLRTNPASSDAIPVKSSDGVLTYTTLAATGECALFIFDHEGANQFHMLGKWTSIDPV